MSEPPRVSEADVERLAAQVGVTIEAAALGAVAMQLAALLAAAQLVDEFVLPAETEPAPRFEP